MSFANKVILITGASSGIGAATAIKFAKEEAKLVLISRKENKVREIATICEKYAEKPLVLICDITNDDEVNTIIEKTVKNFGKLDVLVNNSGITAMKDCIQNPDIIKIYDRVMGTNLRAMIKVTHLAIPELIKTKGSIINVSSVLGIQPGKQQLIYSISKAGIIHLTKCLGYELSKFGIRVNSVCPGPVRTDLGVNMGISEKDSEMVWERMSKKTLLGKGSIPEEVADLIVFLSCNKARSITGGIFPIDNGSLLAGCVSIFS